MVKLSKNVQLKLIYYFVNFLIFENSQMAVMVSAKYVIVENLFCHFPQNIFRIPLCCHMYIGSAILRLVVHTIEDITVIEAK